jgi:hypothetical protein
MSGMDATTTGRGLTWEHIGVTQQQMAQDRLKQVIAHFATAKEQEIEAYKELEEWYGKKGEAHIDTPHKRSKTSRKIEKVFNVCFGFADLVAIENDEMAIAEKAFHSSESATKAVERTGQALAVIKPILAAGQFMLDLRVAVHSCSFSRFTKALLSGLIVVGTTVTAVAILASAELLLKPLFYIQLAISIVSTCRNFVNLYIARRAKVLNKKVLDRNTTELSRIAKGILGNMDKCCKKIQAFNRQLELSNGHEDDHTTMALREAQAEKETLEASPAYKAAQADLDVLLQERLELENERKKIKTRYKESIKDIFYGLSNIAIACVGAFWSSYLALTLTSINVAVIGADYQHAWRSEKAEKKAISTTEGRVSRYMSRLDRSLESTEPKGWSKYFRWLSFGTRRETLTTAESEAIKAAVGVRAQELNKEKEEGTELKEATVFFNLTHTTSLESPKQNSLDATLALHRAAHPDNANVVARDYVPLKSDFTAGFTQAWRNLPVIGSKKPIPTSAIKPARWDGSSPDSTES